MCFHCCRRRFCQAHMEIFVHLQCPCQGCSAKLSWSPGGWDKRDTYMLLEKGPENQQKIHEKLAWNSNVWEKKREKYVNLILRCHDGLVSIATLFQSVWEWELNHQMADSLFDANSRDCHGSSINKWEFLPIHVETLLESRLLPSPTALVASQLQAGC